MNKLLGKIVLFLMQIAMIFIWCGFIIYGFYFMFIAWQPVIKLIQNKNKSYGTRPYTVESKEYYRVK